jgi:hypothetical protein
VLVASASFWEGVDVPGEALQLVVIDKLPFPPPNDPLVEARCQPPGRQGRSAFRLFGARGGGGAEAGGGAADPRESDRGVLVVCDTRLATMGYGPPAGAALPPAAAAADARWQLLIDGFDRSWPALDRQALDPGILGAGRRRRLPELPPRLDPGPRSPCVRYSLLG